MRERERLRDSTGRRQKTTVCTAESLTEMPSDAQLGHRVGWKPQGITESEVKLDGACPA